MKFLSSKQNKILVLPFYYISTDTTANAKQRTLWLQCSTSMGCPCP